MPTVTLPDATKFDADSDKISDSRPELKIMADAINTIGSDYNAGTLGGLSEQTEESLAVTVVDTNFNSGTKVTLSSAATTTVHLCSVSATVTGTKGFRVECSNLEVGITHFVQMHASTVGAGDRIGCQLLFNDSELDDSTGSQHRPTSADAEPRHGFSITRLGSNRFLLQDRDFQGILDI